MGPFNSRIWWSQATSRPTQPPTVWDVHLVYVRGGDGLPSTCGFRTRCRLYEGTVNGTTRLIRRLDGKISSTSLDTQDWTIFTKVKVQRWYSTGLCYEERVVPIILDLGNQSFYSFRGFRYRRSKERLTRQRIQDETKPDFHREWKNVHLERKSSLNQHKIDNKDQQNKTKQKIPFW